jgi:lysophospholipase L1-like esterase
MKKSFTRIVSAGLVVVMLMSAMCISAFAATNVRQYKNYVVIGDSIPSGYGLATSNAPDYKNLKVSHGQLVVGSYPYIVAKAVGAANVSVLSRCGFRTVEALRMLDKTYKYDSISDTVVGTYAQMFIDDHTYANNIKTVDAKDKVTTLQARTTASVKNANLITVNLGSNDTMTYALICMKAYLAKYSTSPLLAQAEKQMKSFGTLGCALIELMKVAQSINKTSQALAVLSASLLKGYAAFKINFATLIKDVEKLNPNAQIVVVGMYNPFKDLKISQYSLVKIGAMADNVVQLMNTYMSTACVYSGTYEYVDVMDTQAYTFSPVLSTNFSSKSFETDFIRNVHPTEVGYQYMASQILTALPTADSSSVSCPIAQYDQNVKTSIASIFKTLIK